MSIKDDILRRKNGWWTAARRSTRGPFLCVVYMSNELINVIEMRCGRWLDCVQNWSCKEGGLVFSESGHSQVNQMRVKRKGVLSLNILLVAGESNA